MLAMLRCLPVHDTSISMLLSCSSSMVFVNVCVGGDCWEQEEPREGGGLQSVPTMPRLCKMLELGLRKHSNVSLQTRCHHQQAARGAALTSPQLGPLGCQGLLAWARGGVSGVHPPPKVRLCCSPQRMMSISKLFTTLLF